ncbi:CLUMA_CG012896, isoform A [Clunio marinus]|uniref:S-formylglutathione hydrolase n=1 Tax=Clunio marinus TaxID=568069 RepID=A0A1J1IHA4_9DIPT|nr:CLUMA_CG012896, isoform A [Clunio marinus]
MLQLKQISSNKSFGGSQKVFSHFSKVLSCDMNFAIFLPSEDVNQKYPVLYYLSGLTCNELNCVQKCGFQKYAAENGIIVVCPDTSPRNIEGLDTSAFSWDFGYGAGFYVDATIDLYKKNFRMYSYVTTELIEMINSNFPAIPGKQSVTGHSMGGHGALICALKNPGLYQSVSAFAPISNPVNCPWGHKAFKGFLGPDESTWKAYDATELVSKYKGPPLELFIDQGSEDQFLKENQLLPNNLVEAAKKVQMPLIYKLRDGYDHSYFFMSTFISEHFAYHAKFLK